jgi:hypothetical protein
LSLQIRLRETVLDPNTSVSLETTLTGEDHPTEGKFYLKSAVALVVPPRRRWLFVDVPPPYLSILVVLLEVGASFLLQ